MRRVFINTFANKTVQEFFEDPSVRANLCKSTSICGGGGGGGIPLLQKGAPDGVAELDANAQLPLTQAQNVIDYVDTNAILQGGVADFSRLSADAVSFNLPAWDGTGSPPSGLLVGDWYLMPDGSPKVRMV